MKITCIIHGNKRSSLQEDLRQNLSGLDVDFLRTTRSGEATGLTEKAIDSGCARVLAVGGDGTLNEVINGILSSSQPDTPFLLYPAGTANDWSRTMPSPKTPEELRLRLTSDTYRFIDAGKITYAGPQGNEMIRYFINIADAGMGANVVRKVNQRSKWMGSHFTFFKAIAETFLTYRNTMIHAKFDNGQYDGLVRALVIANGRFFGSGLCIAPDADPTDGMFSVVIIGNVSLADYLRYLPALRRGEFIRHPGVNYLKSSSIDLRAPAMLQLEADGEYLGFLPATLEVMPGALKML